MKTGIFILLFLASFSASQLAAQSPKLSSQELEIQLYKYTAVCALNRDQGLTREIGAVMQHFKGGSGLAPQWPEGKLSEQEQRWLSACLLSLMNYYGAHIQVSILGSHPKLGDPLALPLEVVQWGREHSVANSEDELTLEEGSFYGNLFIPGKPAYSCSAEPPPAAVDSDLFYRVCASGTAPGETNLCKMVWMGPCAQVCTYRDPAGYYSGCLGADQKIYDEVITIHLREQSLE